MIEQLLGKYGSMRYEHPYTRYVLYRHRRAIVATAISLTASAMTTIGALPVGVIDSRHQLGLFLFSASLLLVAAWAVWRAGLPCAIDPELVRLCRHMRHRSRLTLRASALFWLTAVMGAYILPPVYSIWLK